MSFFSFFLILSSLRPDKARQMSFRLHSAPFISPQPSFASASGTLCPCASNRSTTWFDSKQHLLQLEAASDSTRSIFYFNSPHPAQRPVRPCWKAVLAVADQCFDVAIRTLCHTLRVVQYERRTMQGKRNRREHTHQYTNTPTHHNEQRMALMALKPRPARFDHTDIAARWADETEPAAYQPRATIGLNFITLYPPRFTLHFPFFTLLPSLFTY